MEVDFAPGGEDGRCRGEESQAVGADHGAQGAGALIAGGADQIAPFLQRHLHPHKVDLPRLLADLFLQDRLEERPEDTELMFRGIDLIAKTVAVRYRLSKKAQGDLSTSLAGVFRSLGDLLPGGVLDG